MKNIIKTLSLSCFLISFAACSIILKPAQTDGFKSGYIFVQGAAIPGKNYMKYGLDLQTKFNGSLWVALAEFPLDIPEPLLINSVIESIFIDLAKEGFVYDKSTPFYFAGHSLGGIILQDYLFKAFEKLPCKFDGLILEGSFITRNNFIKNANPKFPPGKFFFFFSIR